MTGMGLFFTADTHFGDHRTLNIHRRPFATVAQMDEALVTGWNAVIGSEDVVWSTSAVAVAAATQLWTFAG